MKGRRVTLRMSPNARGFGDRVAAGLAAVGVTDERVSAWLGAPCGCAERRAKLNQLGEWAASVITAGQQQAKQSLLRLLGEVDQQ